MKNKGLAIQDGKNGETSKHTAPKEVDCMSYVPKEVLYHILSFLPFEYWIIMGMVSKKWQNLFCESPRLLLNEKEIVKKMTRKVLNGLDYYSQLEEVKKARRRFAKLVSYILLSHSNCLIRYILLSFQYEAITDFVHVNKWIHSLMTRDIEELELDFSVIPKKYYELEGIDVRRIRTPPFFELPIQPFHPKFRSFTLNFCRLVSSKFGSFVNLKVLYLSDVIIIGQSIGELLSKCPVLEDLHLYRCSISDNFFVCEEDLKIKLMVLISCLTEDSQTYEIDLSVPKLTKLVIIGRYLMRSNIRNAISLIDCSIDIIQDISDNEQGNFLGLFMINLTHCHNLHLTCWCIQVLSILDIGLSQQLQGSFNNMKNLKLRIGCVKQELPGFILLLQSFPCLESLVLDLDDAMDVDWFIIVDGNEVDYMPEVFQFEEDYFENQFQGITCLQKSLKYLHIHRFMGLDNNIHLIELILRNAQVLENVIIHKKSYENGFPELNVNARLNELRDLHDLPCASSLIQISVEVDEDED